MSKAVIDFCNQLQTVLLGVEDRLAAARQTMEAQSETVAAETKKHIEEAAEQIDAFKIKAAAMAAGLSAELPKHATDAKEKLTDFGLEAQIAMRHAVIFLAEAASKGAKSAATILEKGAKSAREYADAARRETAVTPRDEPAAAEEPAPSPSTSDTPAT